MVRTEQPDTLDKPVGPDECSTATGLVHDAFVEAIMSGINPRAFAEAAIAVGLEELVSRYGEEAVGSLTERFAARVRDGEFSDITRH